MRYPAVLPDYDGVGNRAFARRGMRRPAASFAELDILPGVPEALNALRGRGYSLVVGTNRPDVARGTVSGGLIDPIHYSLLEAANLILREPHQ